MSRRHRVTAAWIEAMGIDALRLWRMPWLLALSLLPPAAMALFVWILSLNVTREPVALVVLERAPEAERMLEILDGDTDAYRLMVTDADTAEGLLRSQRVAAIITIPRGFSEAIARHQGLLLLDLNNIDIDFSDDIRRSLDRSIAVFDGLQVDSDDDDAAPPAFPSRGIAPIVHHPANARPSPSMPSQAMLPRPPYLVGVAEHDVRVSDIGFTAYQLLAVIIYLVLNIGVVLASMLSSRERSSGITLAWAMTPRSPWRAVGARILLCTLVSTAIGCLCLALYPGHAGFSMNVHPLPAILILGACALGGSVLGGVLGSLPLSERSLGACAMLLTTTLFLLGGAYCTPDTLPGWLQQLSGLDPLRYAIDGLRRALFYQQGFNPVSSLVGLRLILLLVVSAVMLMVGFAMNTIRQRAGSR